MIYLIEVQGYTIGGVATTFRFATEGYTTLPSDTPANTFWEGRVKTPGILRQSMYNAGSTSGESEVGYGVIELVNNDGALDYMIDYGFDGWPLKIYTVEESSSPFSSATVRFSGTMEQAEFDESLVTLRIRDMMQTLDTQVQTNTYAGTNVGAFGLEGSNDGNKGRVKPLTFGSVFSVQPAIANNAAQIYQVNDGPIHSVNVFDRGVALTRGANYATLTELQNTAPEPGQYRVHLPGGYFRLGSTPSGMVLADVEQAPGTSTAAQVVDRIVRRAGPTKYVEYGGVRREWASEGWVNYTGTKPYVVTEPTASSGYALRFGDNNGNDQFYAWHTESTRIDDSLFKVSMRWRRVISTGVFYIGVLGVAEDGVSWANPAGANTLSGQYYLASGSSPLGEWRELVVYMKKGATGSGLTPESPRAIHANTHYFKPLFLGNYDGKPGICELDYIKFEVIPVPSNANGVNVLSQDFTNLDAKCSAPVGIYINSETTALVAISEVMNSIGGYCMFDMQNRLRIGRLELPTGTPDHTLQDWEILSISRIVSDDTERGIPAHKVNVKYARNYTVQTQTDMAAAAQEFSEHRGIDYRSATAQDDTIKLQYPLSEELVRETLLINESDAQEEANRLLDIYKRRRDFFEVRCRTDRQIGIGETVLVTYPRFLLDSGKLLRVLSVEPDYTSNTNTIILWG